MLLLRVFVILIILLALIAGILPSTLPQEQIAQVAKLQDFFDISIRILAFGALVKYLCSSHRHHHHHGHPCCHKKGDAS